MYTTNWQHENISSYHYIIGLVTFQRSRLFLRCTILHLIHQWHEDILAYLVRLCLFNKTFKRCSLQHIKQSSAATHMCRVVWAHDMHLLCVACIHYSTCACQICVQQWVHTPVFKVLHELNMLAHACAWMHM